MKKKKDSIVFVIHDSLKDREFAVVFDKLIQDINSVFVVDIDKISPMPPTEPQSGVAAMIDSFDKHKFDYRMISIYKSIQKRRITNE